MLVVFSKGQHLGSQPEIKVNESFLVEISHPEGKTHKCAYFIYEIR